MAVSLNAVLRPTASILNLIWILAPLRGNFFAEAWIWAGVMQNLKVFDLNYSFCTKINPKIQIFWLDWSQSMTKCIVRKYKKDYNLWPHIQIIAYYKTSHSQMEITTKNEMNQIYYLFSTISDAMVEGMKDAKVALVVTMEIEGSLEVFLIEVVIIIDLLATAAKAFLQFIKQLWWWEI